MLLGCKVLTQLCKLYATPANAGAQAEGRNSRCYLAKQQVSPRQRLVFFPTYFFGMKSAIIEMNCGSVPGVAPRSTCIPNSAAVARASLSRSYITST